LRGAGVGLRCHTEKTRGAGRTGTDKTGENREAGRGKETQKHYLRGGAKKKLIYMIK